MKIDQETIIDYAMMGLFFVAYVVACFVAASLINALLQWGWL